MQSLIHFAITRKVTILMFIAAVILLGVMSWTRTPVDLLPNISFPGAAVITSYPGAGPEEVELYVTQVLEGALGTLTNVREIQSISSEESAVIVLLFNWGADMDRVAIEIREKLDQAARFLPDEVTTPTVYKFDPSMLPVMSIAAASNQYSMEKLSRLADTFAQRLERLEGVASVSVSGGIQEEIVVTVDREKLEEYQLPLANITNALRLANLNIPGGSVVEDDTRWLIRTLIRTESVAELEEFIVGTQVSMVPELGQAMPLPVYLADVADITLQPQRQDVINRVNRERNVSLQINKRSDANTVLTANRVKEEMERLADDYPDVRFTVIDDQSSFIQLSVDSLIRNALIGGILALIILLFFLRNFRSTLIIAAAIPISLIGTFILMYFAGLTLNLMTLGGLALGVGMLVDNSVVVLENIFRHLQGSKNGRDAAFDGTKEVGMAITASTLTTIAVFLPVVFIGGMTGILFKELALTVSFSLLASLLVALTVIPMFAAVLLRPEMGGRMTEAGTLATAYRKALAVILRHRLIVLFLVTALFVGSLLTIPCLGGEFMPSLDEGTGRVTITLPDDATMEQTEKAAAQVEDILLADPLVETVSTVIGGTGGGPPGMVMRRSSAEPNRAGITFQLIAAEERSESTLDFVDALKKRLPQADDAEITAEEVSLTGGGIFGSDGIEIELAGSDLERLGEYGEQLKDKLADLPYVETAESSLAERNPEVQVIVDMHKALTSGVNPMAVGSSIRSVFEGETATRITKNGSELSVVVTLQEEQQDSIADIGDVLLPGQGGMQVRVDDVAELKQTTGPRTINRRNNQRIVTVTAQINEDQDILSAQQEIKTLLDEMGLPGAYTASFRGQVREMMDAFGSMKLAMPLAIALVYMVMASQFESLIHPFTVMFTIPFAAIGVLFTLLLSRQHINIPSMIGVVVLVGVVVNNAIVLVDYINQMRARGMTVQDALLEAGHSRLRPILMTTLTTVLGLIPLAVGLGSGGEMQKPLALTIMGGLSVGALLTLFVIPVIYSLFERLFPRATNIIEQHGQAKK